MASWKARESDFRSCLRLFFRPTPSWLSPGRLTRSISAKTLNLQIVMHGRLEADSHKRELVMDLYIVQHVVPSTTKTNNKTTKNKPNRTKNTNKQNKQNVGQLPALAIMCTMTSCVPSYSMAITQKRTQANKKTRTKRAIQWSEGSNKALCGNPGSPQPGSQKSHRSCLRRTYLKAASKPSKVLKGASTKVP